MDGGGGCGEQIEEHYCNLSILIHSSPPPSDCEEGELSRVGKSLLRCCAILNCREFIITAIRQRGATECTSAAWGY